MKLYPAIAAEPNGENMLVVMKPDEQVMTLLMAAEQLARQHPEEVMDGLVEGLADLINDYKDFV